MEDIDEIDRAIIKKLTQNPTITHSDIAKDLNRSQPAIGQRIKKLQERNIISTQIGVNFKLVDMILVKVELITKNPEEIVKMANNCPFIINALKLSGEYNFMIFIAANSLKKINNVIDFHFRNKNYISMVKMDLVVGYAKDFILPVDFDIDTNDPQPVVGCGDKCWKNIKGQEQGQGQALSLDGAEIADAKK